jgi:hypothetical protein
LIICASLNECFISKLWRSYFLLFVVLSYNDGALKK